MTPGAAGLHQPSRPWNHLSPLILILALARLWVMPLWSSFWVDEMGTVFVVQRGADHPSFAVAPQVPQSIYYLLPRAANALFGVSEFGWRLASLLAMAAALLLIAWLAVRLVDPGAAWFAAFACLALRGFDYQAADARPYGLGTLVACACLWFLVRWLDRARWPDALAFVVLGALLWRVQLIFWPFYLVLVSYAASRLAHRDSSVSWKAASAVFALLGLSLVPTLLQAAALYRQAGAHVVVALPTLRDLVLSLKLGLVAVCVAGAWVAHAVAGRSAFATRKPPPRSSSRETVVLIASWWLCQPVCLFAFSRVTGNSVFVARYLWLSLPGAALAATWAAGEFLPSRYWKPAAAVLGVGGLLLNGQWTQLWPWHHNSDWRGAARKVRELVLDPDTPVLCPSPFIEARPPVWRPDYPLPGFLYAHLPVYPIPGKILLFPFEDSPEAEAYASHLTAKRFVLYGGQGQVDFWMNWYAARPDFAGWSHQRFQTFGDVEVVLFQQ
ncbi:MAG TPA: glycosyltransferase family 39 protein [Bryobacteraceae bacterium]|nr:glycosyltransferase family 39 protein [Bryobacteraceae bacterium]